MISNLFRISLRYVSLRYDVNDAEWKRDLFFLNGIDLLLRIFMAFLVFNSVSVLSETPRVKVERVLAWHDPVEVPLYCRVSVPFLSQVSSPAFAELLWVLPEGTAVKKGDIVAVQNEIYLAKDIEVLKLDIDNEASRERYLQKEKVRLDSLSDKKIVSESGLNKLQRDLDEVAFKQQRLQEQLSLATYQHQHLTHYSLVTGQVSKLEAQPGEHLEIGQKIAQLTPTDSKELTCKLPLDILQQIGSLDTTHFMLGEDKLHLNRQRQDVQEDTQTAILYFDTSKDFRASVLVGQRLQVVMSKKVGGATQVSSDALVLDGDEYIIWLLDDSNKVSKQRVKILVTQNTSFVIESDVKAGDLVVVRGKQGLKEAQEVIPVEHNVK